jgi:O-antigen/teichoic acid export membrane protein
MLNLKKDGIQIKFITSGFILNVLFLLLFINLYGTTGAAMAWPAAEMLIFIGYMIYFKMNSIQVVNYSYYNPRLIVGNTLRMVKVNPLKQKALR